MGPNNGAVHRWTGNWYTHRVLFFFLVYMSAFFVYEIIFKYDSRKNKRVNL